MCVFMKRALFLLLALAAFVAAPGCNYGARRERRSDEASAPQKGQPVTGRGLPENPTRAERTNYFQDASSVPGKLKEKIRGRVRLLELALYPTYAFAKIQDPVKLENVDSYELRDGRVGDGEPVKFIGQVPTEQDLEAITFDVSTIDAVAVPRMAADAIKQLGIEGGQVTHMLLKRGIPFNNEVRWRVYVNGTRRNGSVEFDPSGRTVKVWK
jgi:hypothetical protein